MTSQQRPTRSSSTDMVASPQKKPRTNEQAPEIEISSSSALSETFTSNLEQVRGLFTTLSCTLDEHYDRRERIIKCSRDITSLCKRLIFLAHRVTQKPIAAILEESNEKKREILKLFEMISEELVGVNYHRYLRQISPAIQEYIEAVSFLAYLENGTLITKEKIDADFQNELGRQFLQTTDEDYILGIADLTGELMRYAINCVGKGDHTCAMEACQFLRILKAEYDVLRVPTRSYFKQKMEEMQRSLQKVEQACYAITIRGSEYPKEFYEYIVGEHAQNNEGMKIDDQM